MGTYLNPEQTTKNKSTKKNKREYTHKIHTQKKKQQKHINKINPISSQYIIHILQYDQYVYNLKLININFPKRYDI